MRVCVAAVCPRGSAEPAPIPPASIQVVSRISLTTVCAVSGVGVGRRRPHVVRVLSLLTCAETLVRTVRCTAHAGVVTQVIERFLIFYNKFFTKKKT